MTVRVNASRCSHVFGSYIPKTLTVAVAITLLACGEGGPPTAPSARPLPGGAVHDAFTLGDTSVSTSGDTAITNFTIDPTRDLVYPIAGKHYLYVSNGGLCDLSSPYGPDYWDTPCTASSTSVAVTAKSWIDENGRPHIDFQPALRFAAQRGKIKSSALLFMYDTVAVKTPNSTILYCTDLGQCVDEGKHDRLLTTDTDRHTGYLFRQIKHFSGYEVAAGFARGF